MFTLNLDADADRTVMDARDDEVQIYGGATMTVNDTNNFNGVDIIRLASDGTAGTYNLTLSDALVQQTTAHMEDVPFIGTNAILGDGIDDARLTITVDSDVPAGSVVNIDTTGMTLSANVTVISGSNVTVNVTGPAVNMVNLLEYTLNADNLTGTAGDDTFVADILAEVQGADNIDGLGQVLGDTLQLNFAVNNVNRTIETLLNHTGIQNVEVLEFNTNGDVSFQANRTAAGDFSAGGDYDFDTFTFGGGNDTLFFGGATATSYTVNGRGGNDTVHDNFDWTGDGVVDGANSTITFNGGNGDDNFIFGSDAMMTPADLFAPGAGTDTVTVFDTTEVDVDRGEIAALVTDGGLERFVADSDGFVDIFLNNADLYDFTGGVAVFSLDAGTDVFISASSVTDPSESIDVTINAGDDILAVGGAGDDIINILAGETDGDDIGVADDAAGVLGLRGGDTIYLEPAQVENDYVVYKTPQDGGLEGQNGGAGINDMIYNFDVVHDKIVFSKSTIGGLPGLARYTDVDETGDGWMGDTLDKNGDDIVDAVTDPFVAIDLTVDELAVFTGTGLSDADLLDLATIAGFINGTGLDNDVAGSQIVFSVQGSSDTGLYSFASDSVNGSIEVAELSLMAVIDDALLLGGDYHYA